MKNKIKDIIIFISLILFIASTILVRELNNLDELWNYNFANCISKGLVPYKDFNMVQTPLLPIICGTILKIFGRNLYIMRLLAIILCASVVFMIYKILKKLKVNEFLIYLAGILITYIMRPYFTIDYNWATLLVTLIMIYLEIIDIRNKEQLLKFNIKKDLLLGILAGICITFKQSTGLLIAIVTVGYKILEIRKKDDIKEFLKIALFRGIGVCIPIMLIGIYLATNNAIGDFIDYCILGVATFSNKISYIDRLINNEDLIFKVLSIIPILLIPMMIIYFCQKKKELLVLSAYGLAQVSVVYPISDESHFVIGIVPIFIGLVYLLNLIVDKILNKLKIKERTNFVLSNTIITFIICMVLVNIGAGIKQYRSLNINYEIKHYEGIPVTQSGIENIKNIDNFILESKKNVYILDATAALYTIPIDKYNKNYDMFLKGNLGSKGEEGQIENLKLDKEKIVLIMRDDYKRNWQNPELVRNYVINNMEKIGKIGVFDIYE